MTLHEDNEMALHNDNDMSLSKDNKMSLHKALKTIFMSFYKDTKRMACAIRYDMICMYHIRATFFAEKDDLINDVTVLFTNIEN